jgi:uncharacterized Zn-binding protein involved in type VI secretion
MSRLVARVGDRTIGTCFAHDPPITVGGTIVSGSSDSTVNSKLDARIGDTVRTDCGHTAKIVSGSPNVLTNEIPTARIGDKVTGIYVAEIISGSPNTVTD